MVIADLFFVYHGTAMVIIQSVQVLIYPRGKNRVSGYSIILCITLWLIVIFEVFFTHVIVNFIQIVDLLP